MRRSRERRTGALAASLDREAVGRVKLTTEGALRAPRARLRADSWCSRRTSTAEAVG